MEVEIICRERIKPSSPTPPHLKTHKLCLLDQFQDHIFLPSFLFYPLDVRKETDAVDLVVSRRIQLLKQSLSQTLTHFYPLAGRMMSDFFVDCNDEGVYFAEATAKATPLEQLLGKPDLNLMNKFFPIVGSEQLDAGQIEGADVAKVQVTSFSCGGIVVSATISHRFCDGIIFGLFMKSWAAAARAALGNKIEEPVACLDYGASSLFPQHEAYPTELTWKVQGSRLCKTGKFAVKRFLFDANAIADLKAKAAAITASSGLQNPSRVEAVSAFITRRIMAALKSKSSLLPLSSSSSPGSNKPAVLTHSVNLRRVAKPPLPDHLVGNVVWNANALLCSTDDGKEIEAGDLVNKFREATGKIDENFVTNLQGGKGFHNLSRVIRDEARLYSDYEVTDQIAFGSWVHFGFYDIDFGWGKPIWVSLGGFGDSIVSLPTLTILMNTRVRGQIEAWVHMLDEYMSVLEVDEELLAFATLDPSPLTLSRL